MGGASTAPLVWAPHDHDGFLMRLQGHRREAVCDYLGPDPETGGLRVRHQAEDGSVVAGFARRAGMGIGIMPRFGPQVTALGQVDADTERGQLAFGPGSGVLRERGGDGPAARHIQQALEQGLDHMTVGWPGLSEEERVRMRLQLQQWTVPLAGALSQHPPLAQALVGQGGHGGGPAFILNFEQLFGFLEAQGHASVEHTGVPENVLMSWLDSKAVRNTEELEPDWQCPICFDGSLEGLVACCRANDQSIHAFHRECIKDWLLRRNECPTCRRNPLVEEDSSGTP